MKEEHLKTLGLDPTTEYTPQEIKKIYKKLALKYHPDKTGNNEQLTEEFKNITNAYTKLLNIDENPEEMNELQTFISELFGEINQLFADNADFQFVNFMNLMSNPSFIITTQIIQQKNITFNLSELYYHIYKDGIEPGFGTIQTVDGTIAHRNVIIPKNYQIINHDIIIDIKLPLHKLLFEPAILITFIDEEVIIELDKPKNNQVIDFLQMTKIKKENCGLLRRPHYSDKRGDLIVNIHPTFNTAALKKYKDDIIKIFSIS